MTLGRTVRRIVTTASALGLALAGSAVLSTASASAAGTDIVFTGQASITVATYDYCDLTTGQRRPTGQRTWSAPVTLVLSDPADDGEGGVEQNPFHFSFSTDDQVGTGAFSVYSAQVATTPQTFRPVTLTHWTAAYDQRTGALQAELTEDHGESAAARNLVNVEQQLIPCRPQFGAIPMVSAMAEGTQLSGTLAEAGGAIDIVGTSTDGMYDFVVSTELTRAG